MRVVYKELSKGHFDYIVNEFLPKMEATLGYLYLEFEYTFLFYAGPSQDDDTIVIKAETDHIELERRIESELYKNDDISKGIILFYNEYLEKHDWRLIFGASNGKK